MRLLLINLLAVTLVACGGGSSQPSAPPVPVAGTLLSSECDGYTLVERFANGQGGSEERVMPRSPDCGWNPTPYGELSETFCEDPYTLVSVYHDGEYGFFEGREEEVEECGYIAPSLEVSIDNTFGDRFKPIVVTVDYKVQGETSGDWTYEIEVGRAVKVDDNTLHIFGDGSGPSVDYFLTINGETYTYVLKPEPRCSVQDGSVDCLGYTYRGPSRGLIYYGEEDTQQVTWELIALMYDDDCEPAEDERYLCAREPSSGARSGWEQRVGRMSKALRESGVFITLVLKDVRYTNSNRLEVGEFLTKELDGDIGIGRGTTCPNTCGCAYAKRSFGTPGFGWSICDWDTDIHELGHAVGLAHGPENDSNQARGYVFPQFGHGWNRNLCGTFDGDLMSYERSSKFFNSKQSCAEAYPDRSVPDSPVIDRAYADSAYHLNRVRYDVSLINDEHKKGDISPRTLILDNEEWRELILD